MIMGSTTMSMLSILVVLVFFIPFTFALDPFQQFSQLNLPPGPIGPESVALDRFHQEPYVGVSDGRILKYKSYVGFVDFAYTAPNRSKQICDGVTDVNLATTCGRPLGFSFNALTGILYIVDFIFGVFEVGPQGGQATLIANSVGGVPFRFLDGIDVDPSTGEVFIIDGSLTFDLRNITLPNFVPDSNTGRLIKYNPITKELKVLLDGLALPIGPAVSLDGTFVVFSEIGNKIVKKYWLKGPKKNTTEILLNLPANPIKIKRATTFGEFWVAVNKNFTQHPLGYKFNSNGQVLEVKDFQAQFGNSQVTVVQEYNGNILFVGSRTAPFVGIYTIF